MKTWLFIGVILLALAACSPTRYTQSQAISTPEMLASTPQGGHVKRGSPYQIAGKWYYPLESGELYDQTGIASWYGDDFHGKKTANGEIYDMHAFTAAHTTLPLPSIVLVTNLENGKQIKVRVNDRGPFVKSRLIDLSYAAAVALDYHKQGTTRVRVETLETPTAQALSATPYVAATQQKETVVQIGAFGEKANAAAVVQSLQQQLGHELPPWYVMEVAGMYRVRLGPFVQEHEAQQTLDKVRGRGFDHAMIVHE